MSSSGRTSPVAGSCRLMLIQDGTPRWFVIRKDFSSL